jgi:hypothetical protein
MQLLMMQFSPTSCHFIPLRSMHILAVIRMGRGITYIAARSIVHGVEWNVVQLSHYKIVQLLLLLLLSSSSSLFIVYLTTLFLYLRLFSIDVGGKPAASAQFLQNPDSSVRARAI